MISETIEIEAAFYDVDSCEVVWHGNYVKYLEIARCRLLDKVGYNYRDMQASGYFFPIVDMRIKYIKPIVFGQTVSVKASLVEWQYRLKISYLIQDSLTHEKLTTATTVQAAVATATQELQLECPPILQQKVQSLI